ncbi:MAG: hypothetical protein HZA95_01090 [Candidatus Vogelbacteria bacterium]|nr:hypothetical protein [Candidatus Vogelbacteria bacterium]
MAQEVTDGRLATSHLFPERWRDVHRIANTTHNVCSLHFCAHNLNMVAGGKRGGVEMGSNMVYVLVGTYVYGKCEENESSRVVGGFRLEEMAKMVARVLRRREGRLSRRRRIHESPTTYTVYAMEVR